MSDFRPLKLFLSYGRQDAADAEAVRDRLSERGHEVWFDTQRLETGADWEAGIEAGLKDCDKVVLLMTPHAVRQRVPGDPASSDGFCLNEIAKAQQLHKPIIPVMIKSLPGGPPTSICRIQWLDMTGCPPSTSGDLPRYRALIDRLLAAIERDELDFEGGQSRLLDLLRPLDYSVEFSKHIGRFRGREWLVDKVDRWLATDDPSRVLWMLGKPGLGKTAFAAYLCHKLASAWHVFVHDHEDKSDPRRAVLSIAYQLATSLPEYHARLVNKITADDVQKAAPTLFDDLILAPLTVGEFPDPGRSLLVVIDAIDEASRRSGDDFAQLIANRARQLPPWLRLVVTSRPDLELEEAIRDREPYVETFEIAADGASNRADVRAYVAHELEDLGHRVGDTVIASIVDRSEGIFLYASRVIQSLRDGLLTVDRLSELPKGIRSWYRDEFQRRFTDTDVYERDLVPVLNLIIAQRAPLPVPLIQDALKLKRRDIDRRLRALGSLFEIGMSGVGESAVPVIMPAHKTLSEWLGEVDPRTRRAAAGRFSVDVDEGHECLADHGWGLYENRDLDSSAYCRRFLPEHLLMADQPGRVREMLCDLDLFDKEWSGDRRFDAMRLWRAISDKFDPAASYLEALDRFAESGAQKNDQTRLASRIGAFLLEMGLPQEAMSLIRRAVELRSTTTGADRLDLAESLQHLADAYRDQGQLDDAHPLYTQAIKILEEELGPDSAQSARVFHSLAILLWKEKRFNESLSYNHRALNILENTASANPRHLADCVNDMGVVLRDMVPSGDVAAPYYRRALGIFESNYGPNDPGVAQCLHNLAMLHPGSSGGEDIDELERARQVLESTFVAHHPDNQTCRRTLALHYERRADFAKAIALCRTVLDNEIASFGAASAQAQQARQVLERTERRRRRASAFVAAARGVIETDKTLAAPVHEIEHRIEGDDPATKDLAQARTPRATVDTAFQLAAFLQDYGYHNAAALVYEPLVETLDEASDQQPELRKRALRRYSRCLGVLGRRAEAIEHCRSLLDEPDAAPALRRAISDFEFLYTMLYEVGRHEEARAEFKRSVDLVAKLGGESEALVYNQRVALLLNQWAMTLKNQHGKYEEAEPYYRLAIELDPAQGSFPGNLALLLTSSLDRHDEAEELYRRSLEIDPTDATMLGNYGFFLHHVRGDVAAAKARYREALEQGAAGSSVGSNYAALLLTTGRSDETLELLETWWEVAGNGGHDNLSGRLLFVRVALERSRSAPAEFFLGQLKFLLEAGVLHSPWRAEALFAWLDERLSDEEAAFLRKVGRAISSNADHEQLNDDPSWKAIPFISVAEPWPS